MQFHQIVLFLCFSFYSKALFAKSCYIPPGNDNLPHVFGPTDFGGWSYRLTPVRSFIPGFSQKPVIGSFRNLAWSWRIIKETKWWSRIFRKRSGSFKNFQKCGQKWGFLTFAGNLSHWPQFLLTQNDSTKCLWTPCEKRISGKNLVLEILSCLQIQFLNDPEPNLGFSTIFSSIFCWFCILW